MKMMRKFWPSRFTMSGASFEGGKTKMKLAEALIQRADCQKRIAQLKSRLLSNAKVQEGDAPAESPENLLAELERSSTELVDLIKRINKTNSTAVFQVSEQSQTRSQNATSWCCGIQRTAISHKPPLFLKRVLLVLRLSIFQPSMLPGRRNARTSLRRIIAISTHVFRN